MASGTQVTHPAGGGATFDATTGELSGRAGIVCVCVLPGSWSLYELTNHRLAVCKWSVRTMSHTISWDHSTLCSVFSPLCIRRNANTRSVQSLGTLLLLTPSLWAHPHTLTVGTPSLLTSSLWAHPHTLTPSLLPSYLPHCVPGLGGPSVYAPSLSPREGRRVHSYHSPPPP